MEMPPKQALSKVGEYSLISKFLGYHAREDFTTLPAGTLVSPSQNVVIKTSGRVASVSGYTLDGPTSSVIDSGILSNFDFTNFKGDVRNLRAGFLTSAGNDGKLQYRYLDALGTVNWVNLKTALTNIRLSYCEYWDITALVKLCTWVDGSNNVFQWNGAVTTFASATSNTVTKQGTNTWGQEGFSATGSIVIGGVTATYSGGAGTTTLTGVSVDFSASAVASIIHQSVITTPLASMTSILTTFGPTVIGCGKTNQIYLGASNSNSLYISKNNNFKDFSFSTPRIAGEGALKVLQAPATKFIAQESNLGVDTYDMYISEGLSAWQVVRLTVQVTSASDGTQTGSEQLDLITLKTAPLQGALSERLVCKMKNNIVFVGNDKVANFLGYLSYQFVPAIIDFSFPIIDDQASYNFTDASVFYHKNYIYEAIPKAGLVRVYNMTDQTKQYMSFNRDFEDVTQQPWFWEAPITYPVSGFYVTPDKGLCMHSYTTSESYQAFTGLDFNGQDITANATFSYDDKGDRTQSKMSDEIWVEGYIQQNTVLNVGVTGDLDAEAVLQVVTIDGSDNSIVAYGSGAHSLGTTPLGAEPLGGANLNTVNRPAWFHVSKTLAQNTCYLEQLSFATKGVALAWELICFGTRSQFTLEGNNSITQ